MILIRLRRARDGRGCAEAVAVHRPIHGKRAAAEIREAEIGVVGSEFQSAPPPPPLHDVPDPAFAAKP